MITQEIYNEVLQYPLKVYNIFQTFFGEDKVDIHGIPTLETAILSDLTRETLYNPSSSIYILVYFPFVTITNEFDRSVNIKDLYAKVPIDINGTLVGGFSLNRATYSQAHFENNYMHSHVSCIPYSDFSIFQRPCTGTGPINGTIANLNRSFDEDLWNLFCLELSKYVTVESIAGTPYHILESVGSSSVKANSTISYCSEVSSYITNKIRRVELAHFIKYVIESKQLKVNYFNNNYSFADSEVVLQMKLSNLFIDWYNTIYRKSISYNRHTVELRNIFNTFTYSNGDFYHTNTEFNYRDYHEYVGKYICTFKGKDIRVAVEPSLVLEDNTQVKVLIPSICNIVLSSILNIINFKYGKNNSTTETSSSKTLRFL